ncbi:hypothetical protein [Clostridium sp. YIM B02555]|uniref:hypothetical protein n=1 Tax=Clostridium sp. YIM B02555 TaxID=2911968 RepID=UPI001EEE4CB1|nr:hypothetical protein [Clostridium sp. YIM B02555]
MGTKNSITLKELVNELIIKEKIRSTITRKYIRTILRSDKGKPLEEISFRTTMNDRWEWPIELKDDVEIKLLALINH